MSKKAPSMFFAAMVVFAMTASSSAQKLTESAQNKLAVVVAGAPGAKAQLARPRSLHSGPVSFSSSARTGQSGGKSNPGGLPGIDSVPNFTRAFSSRGQVWPYTMVGNDPALGRHTEIPVRIIAVSLELQNEDLVTTTKVPIEPFVRLALNSPNFRESDYSTGEDIQYADAVQRAEFFNVMKKNWHTDLRPVRVVEHVSIFVPRTITATTIDAQGNASEKTVNTYQTSTADDGSTVVALLDQFFDQAFFDTAANAIVSRRFSTDALNIILLPNTVLVPVDQDPNISPTLGFHTFLFDDSVSPVPVWVTIFANWLSPGALRAITAGSFDPGIVDVTVLSHEISESINDPFLINSVPAWEFPGFAGICGGDLLEIADPIETLPRQTFPVTIKEDGRKFTYHPQIMAMRQWFDDADPSDAIAGTYSYPDTTALTSPAVPFGPLACPVPQ